MITEYVKVNNVFGEDYKKVEEKKTQDRILKEKRLLKKSEERKKTHRSVILIRKLPKDDQH